MARARTPARAATAPAATGSGSRSAAGRSAAGAIAATARRDARGAGAAASCRVPGPLPSRVRRPRHPSPPTTGLIGSPEWVE